MDETLITLLTASLSVYVLFPIYSISKFLSQPMPFSSQWNCSLLQRRCTLLSSGDIGIFILPVYFIQSKWATLSESLFCSFSIEINKGANSLFGCSPNSNLETTHISFILQAMNFLGQVHEFFFCLSAKWVSFEAGHFGDLRDSRNNPLIGSLGIRIEIYWGYWIVETLNKCLDTWLNTLWLESCGWVELNFKNFILYVGRDYTSNR